MKDVILSAKSLHEENTLPTHLAVLLPHCATVVALGASFLSGSLECVCAVCGCVPCVGVCRVWVCAVCGCVPCVWVHGVYVSVHAHDVCGYMYACVHVYMYMGMNTCMCVYIEYMV